MPSTEANISRVPPPTPDPIGWGEGGGTPHPNPLPVRRGEGVTLGGRPRVNQTPWWPGRGVALLLSTLGAVTAAAVLFCFNPSFHSFYPVCLFYRTTGLLCPGCGSLRALHQLLHGHVIAAFHCNALLMLALPLLAWRLGRYYLRQRRQLPATFTVRPLWLWAALGVMLLFSLLRNLPGPQFAWLAP